MTKTLVIAIVAALAVAPAFADSKADKEKAEKQKIEAKAKADKEKAERLQAEAKARAEKEKGEKEKHREDAEHHRGRELQGKHRGREEEPRTATAAPAQPVVPAAVVSPAPPPRPTAAVQPPPAPPPAPAAKPPPTVSAAPPTPGVIQVAGRWVSNAGIVYDITQAGSTFRWTVVQGAGQGQQIGSGSIAGKTANASWTPPNAGQTSGVITENAGVATRIQWANGAVFIK